MSSYVGWKRGLVVFIFMCGFAHLCEAGDKKKPVKKTVDITSLDYKAKRWADERVDKVRDSVEVNIGYDDVEIPDSALVGKGSQEGMAIDVNLIEIESKEYVRLNFEKVAVLGAKTLLDAILSSKKIKESGKLEQALWPIDFLVFALYDKYGDKINFDEKIKIPKPMSIKLYDSFDAFTNLIKTSSDDANYKLFVKNTETEEILINFRKKAKTLNRYRYLGNDKAKSLYLYLEDYEKDLSIVFTDAQSLTSSAGFFESVSKQRIGKDTIGYRMNDLTLGDLLDTGAKLLHKEGGMWAGLWQTINKLNYLLSELNSIDKEILKGYVEEIKTEVEKLRENLKEDYPENKIIKKVRKYLKNKMKDLEEKITKNNED